jgi:hypothetical protein
LKLLLIFMLSCCFTGTGTDGGIIIKIPAGIELSEQEVREILPKNARNIVPAYDMIEIVIYYFSLGIEKFTFSDTDPLTLSSQKGEIQALIKLKKNAVLTKALFVKADGSSREDILRSFSRSIADILHNP